MSATSETEICNLGLTLIGHKQISNLDEGTKAADLCRLHYPRIRDAVLRAHPWNCAIKRATLALESSAPNHEFLYQHTLPDDCLKVVRTNWEAEGYSGTAIYGFPGMVGGYESPVPYRIEGRKLLCNEQTVKLEYIARITDVSQFDELLTDVIAQRIAATLAMPLADNQALAKEMWNIYTVKLNEARTTDAQEGTPREAVDTSPWLVARV